MSNQANNQGQQKLNKIAIGCGESPFEPTDVVRSVVFAPNGRGDSANQYAVIVQAFKGIKIIPQLCKNDVIAFMVTGDWEIEGLGDSIKSALFSAKTSGKVISSNNGRDWLMNTENNELLVDPNVLTSFARQAKVGSSENSFIVSPLLEGDSYFIFAGTSRVEVTVNEMINSIINAMFKPHHLVMLRDQIDQALNAMVEKELD